MITFFGEKLSIRFALCGYREILSICLCASFSFSFEGGILGLIVPSEDAEIEKGPIFASLMPRQFERMNLVYYQSAIFQL